MNDVFSILIKKNDTYKFYMTKKEIMKTITVTEQDEDGNDISVEKEVGTNQFVPIKWTCDNLADLEAMCIELLKTYSLEQIAPIKDMSFEVDLLFTQN